MTQPRVYTAMIVWLDGSPAVDAIFTVASGSAPTPEVAHRADERGEISVALPKGVFEVLVRAPDGRVARTSIDSTELAPNFRLTLGDRRAPPDDKETDMTMSVSNISAPTKTATLRSVSNATPAELELAPQTAVIAATSGSPGEPDPEQGESANLLVSGTEPIPRPEVPITTLESVIEEDERERVKDPEHAPWRMICSLEIHAPNGKVYVGTGWFAGPCTIVTAGHCVHAAQMGGWATKIVVRPGRNGASAPFGVASAVQFSTTDRWLDESDPDFDYGAIHLGAAGPQFADEVGWFSTAVLSDAALKDQRVNLSGYPGDKGGDEQWFHAKQVVFTQARRIFYDVDTMGGQSGSPVWLETAEGPRVVGIHAYGVGAAPAGVIANSAPRITVDVLGVIQGWIAQ